MAKRKPRSLPPKIDPPAKTKAPAITPLCEKESVAGMQPPNHNFPLHVVSEGELELCGMKRNRRCCWPLTSLLRNPKHDESDLRTVGVFVNPMHGAEHWTEWADRPPTWMDPHLFLSMCLKDPRVQKVLRIAFKKNRLRMWKRLLPLFDEIFDSVYLPHIMEQFGKYASPLIAQWLVRSYADEQLDKLRDKPARRSKKRSVE